jgi:hypothetical protein
MKRVAALSAVHRCFKCDVTLSQHISTLIPLESVAAMQFSDCLFDERGAALHLYAQRGSKMLLNDITLVLRGGVISVLLGPPESVATLFDCLRCPRSYLESCGLKIKGKVSFNVEVSEPLLKPALPFVATYFPGDEDLLPPSMTPREVLLWTARVRAAACSSAFASCDADVNDHLEQQLWVAGSGPRIFVTLCAGGLPVLGSSVTYL